jgi:hypothetical protein
MGDCYTQLSLVAQGSSKVANRPRRIPPRSSVPPTTTLLPIALHSNLNATNRVRIALVSSDVPDGVPGGGGREATRA